MNSTTKYWVEVYEDGVGKIVPHTQSGSKPYIFFNKKEANKFKEDLKENNPGNDFRLVKYVESYEFHKWENYES